MARRAVRFLAILIALGVVFYSRSRGTSSRVDEDDTPAADTSADGRVRPTVQEGLGASVAILLDQSGSMEDAPDSGGDTPKYRIAREAIAQVLAQTDSFVTLHPDFQVNVGLYVFDGDVRMELPIARYRGSALTAALANLPEPSGNTAIGDAMQRATRDLYAAGTIRKYLLVVTDGANTSGREPDVVAREIARRSEGAVKLYMVAFDIDAARFGFVNEVRGAVLHANDGPGLRASLDTLYRGRILAEAVDAGETIPARTDSAGTRGSRPVPSSVSPIPPR